ncbi:MAG: pyridoxal-phosphate dependent enzyme [Desulfobacterales bacterium]|jgi:threonine dehydratase
MMRLSDHPIFGQQVRRTPLLSPAGKENLLCKLECCQVGGSFKIRGSLATLLALEAAGNRKGVITASMGNTASGLAYAGRLFKYPVAVVMPATVSATKLEATRKIGAEVILKGSVGDDALEHAFKLAKERDILFVHPHKTPSFLEGNATIAHEIIAENPAVEQIYIPIGGGGLASGICRYIREHGLSLRPIGVEAERAPAFSRSFEKGRPVRLDSMETIADALTLMEPDPDVFAYLYQNLAKVVTVSEIEIIHAMKMLYDEFRVIAEPGGAAPLAAMLGENPPGISAAIISGGNISLEAFQKITLNA